MESEGTMGDVGSTNRVGALYRCIAAIPQYQDRNPEYAGMARHALDQILTSR